MKKNIIALVAAAAVVALTGAGASAWTHDLKLYTKGVYNAGQTMSVQINGAKVGCDVQIKVNKNEEFQNNQDSTEWDSNDGTDNSQVSYVNVKFPTKDYATAAVKAPSLAGYYQAEAFIKQTTLGCKNLGDYNADTRDITVGEPVYVDSYNANLSDELNAGRNDYLASVTGNVRSDVNDSNKLRAGVTVELWVRSFSGDKLYKAASAVTNALGEFKINYTYDDDLHRTAYYQLRIARTAKFFNYMYTYPPFGPVGNFFNN